MVATPSDACKVAAGGTRTAWIRASRLGESDDEQDDLEEIVGRGQLLHADHAAPTVAGRQLDGVRSRVQGERLVEEGRPGHLRDREVPDQTLVPSTLGSKELAAAAQDRAVVCSE